MNIKNLTTRQIRFFIKKYTERYDGIKTQFWMGFKQQQYLRLIEKYTQAYIERTGKLPE